MYETLESVSPKIYLLELQSNKWQFLADTFTEYLRMCIAHLGLSHKAFIILQLFSLNQLFVFVICPLGLPYWELCFAHTCHLPSWAEQLFLLLAPHLLERNSNEATTNRLLPVPQEPVVYNELDLSIFRTKPKCSKQTNKFNK